MPLTKQDILDALSLLPLSKLEVLYDYQRLLLIPKEDLLTHVNMSQMVAEAHNLANQYFPEWTDRSASDFGQFLIELFALFSEKDFWYLNAFAQQSLLTKMSIYSSAFIRSIELGYRPETTVAASANFTIDFSSGNALNYETGDLLVVLEDGTKFTNTSVLSLPNTLNNFLLSTTLRQGQYNKETYSFNGKSIDLRKTKIDISTIELYVEGVLWTRVNVLGQSSPTSTHYIVLPEEDGRCSIFFGEDGYGLKPAVGSLIEVKYLNCSGSEGNVANQTATISKSLTQRQAFGAVMNGVATGGKDADDLNTLKYKTLNYFNYRRSLLNETAVRTWLKDQPEVSKAQVIIVGNSVTYFFRNAQGDAPTIFEINDINNRMTPLVSVGFHPNYVNTTDIPVNPIVCDFYILTGYDFSEIVSIGKQLIQDYTNPAVLADYGRNFNLSDLVVLLVSRIEGLQNVVITTVGGNPAQNINVPNTQILRRIDLSDITINTIAVNP